MTQSAPVELIACETCGSAERETLGSTRGERLLSSLRTAHAARPDPAIRILSTRCLWACSRSCALHLRSAGRVGYVLCELEPTANTAEALLAYAALYAATQDGAVPLKQRPEALRGHFMCRIPPAADSCIPSDQSPNAERAPT